MTHPAVDELRVLRRRAYGPAADIHLDPEALDRLRQLENNGPTPEPSGATAPDAQPSLIELAPPDGTPPLPSTVTQPDSPPAVRRRVQFRPRRSTVMIVLAVVLIAAAAVAALTLVQRVQSDPLQVGASQMARLWVDPGFNAPTELSPDPTRELVAYRDFYEFRPVIQKESDPGAQDECMTIYQPELLEISNGGYSYSGQMFTACAAGAFPAAVTITVLDDFPEQFLNAYPVGTPLQFVYDRSNNEIVIFRG